MIKKRKINSRRNKWFQEQKRKEEENKKALF